MRIYKDISIKLINSNDSFNNYWYFVWLCSRRAILRTIDNRKVEDVRLGDNGGVTFHTFGGANIYEPDEFYVGTELVRNQEYKRRIEKLNLQFNNMDNYIFEIQGSCLFRDLIFNFNRVGQWAESNRFLFSILGDDAIFDESNYPISSEYKGFRRWEDQFDRYMAKIREDPITDHNRLEMPYSISSRFWISINRKSLINFVSMLNLKFKSLYALYGRKLFNAVDLTESDLVPYVDAGLSQYWANYENWKDGTYTRVNDFYIINIRMGMILYSQFLRQQDTIISGYYNLVESSDNDVIKGDTPVDVVFVAHKDKLLRTITNRLCNFAQHSGNDLCSWSKFINIFLNDLVKSTDDFKKMLPCKFNCDGSVSCKFIEDTKFRQEGIEKRNTICPLIFKDLELARTKMERDNNEISKWYYKLTKELLNNHNNQSSLDELLDELLY